MGCLFAAGELVWHPLHKYLKLPINCELMLLTFFWPLSYGSGVDCAVARGIR